MGALLALAIPALIGALMPKGSSPAQIRAATKQTEDVSKDLERINADKAKAKQDLEDLNRQKTQLSQGDIGTYHKNMQKCLDREIEAVERLPDPAKTENFSTAMMGSTSAGKSSLANKMWGLRLKTSPLRCTEGSELVASRDGIDIYDIFGENNEQTYHNVNQLMLAKTIHTIIVVYTDCADNSINMARLMKALKVNIVFFRNKSEDLTSAEVKEVAQADAAQFQKHMGVPAKVIVGSAKNGLGCDELRKVLDGQKAAMAQNGSKRQRTQ